MSSDGGCPCCWRYSFLLHWSILDPLQYCWINPLQASAFAVSYFLKNPQVSNNSHACSIYSTFPFLRRPFRIDRNVPRSIPRTTRPTGNGAAFLFTGLP